MTGTGREHGCPVPGCGTVIATERLMCRPHWYQVPRPLRDAVWRTWRSGAGVLTVAYRQAVADAVAAVTGQDGAQ